MSISKKDFICLAEQIKYTLRGLNPVERIVAITVVQAVADGCRRLNANFDRNRFFAACEVTQEDLK